MINYSEPSQSMPGPNNIFRTILGNGIVLLVRSNFNSPSVIISGYIQAGSLFDSLEKLGLADFTAMMLTRGTMNRDFHEFHDAMESCGANLGFSAAAHTTSFNGRSLVEDLPLQLKLLSECLIMPSFPLNQEEKLRVQLLTSLSLRSQDTTEMASLTFDQILFANHPYSQPDDGYPETIHAITHQDLVDFHKSNYGPKGMVLSIVGAVDPGRTAEMVQQTLGNWKNPFQPDPPLLPPITQVQKTITKKIRIREKYQSDIIMGSLGPQRKNPDYLPVSLANSILGQFGMMGRIGDAVREKSGLAYYAYSTLNAGIGPGSWEVNAGVNPVNVPKAIKLIRQEISKFGSKGVSAEELTDSQANFIGRLPLSLESNAGVANALLNIERFDLGLDYYLCYPDLVRSIKTEEIQAVTRKYLIPDKLVIAVAGS